MEPLDLTKRPPRSPREKIGGLYFLGRTIDKMRALLPGGNAGEYRIPGFSERLITSLGIDRDRMLEAVRDAKNEDEVVTWVREHSDPAFYDTLNAAMECRKAENVAPEYREMFVKSYGPDVPPETVLFDLIESDDARLFHQ